MEQVYYTQCPMGYGLGASNGFQIKRMSAGYPLSGDFRHLGMKASLPTSRALAPIVLRYRRDGDDFELTRLTPRAFEYHTERGLWGRPGGVFAHALRLTAHEIEALTEFPAGLIHASFWQESDTVPSAGKKITDLVIDKVFTTRPPIAAGIEVSLPRLLTAVALVMNEGRTLFVIDEPARLADVIALLTFAFPSVLRRTLTFSTYHERPEELPGYRISGTTGSARPNRPALRAQGIIADLTTGEIEPAVTPAKWAETLSAWIIRWNASDQNSWRDTARRVGFIESFDWSTAALDALFALESLGSTQPQDLAGWSQIANMADWAGGVGMGGECISLRNANWWLHALDSASQSSEGRVAFLAHAKLEQAWTTPEQAAEWGMALAGWFQAADTRTRNAALMEVGEAASMTVRTVFVASAISRMSTEDAHLALVELKGLTSFDRASLLPLEVRGVLTRLVETGKKVEVKALLGEALNRPGILPLVLAAVQAEVHEHPNMWHAFAPFVPSLFETAAKQTRFEGERWALRQPEASRWLTPSLRRVFAIPANRQGWNSLRDRTPWELHGALCRIIMQLTADPSLPGEGEGFRWAVEELLLPGEPGVRPHDATWPSRYLTSSVSDIELMNKLFGEAKLKALVGWLDEARVHNELSEAQIARLKNLRSIASARRTPKRSAFEAINLSIIHHADRAPFLAQWIQDIAPEEMPYLLDAIGAVWTDSFTSDSTQLRGLGEALTTIPNLISLGQHNPTRWKDALNNILGQLRIAEADRWQPLGLGAEVIAATLLVMESRARYKLASDLLNNDQTWKSLFVYAKRSIDPTKPEVGLAAFGEWEHHLDKPIQPARYAEIFLNACDGATLAAIVAAFAEKLKTLPLIHWWNYVRYQESCDDIRDAFARLAPMVSLREMITGLPLKLADVRHWMLGPSKHGCNIQDSDSEALFPLNDSQPKSKQALPAGVVNLSSLSATRWRLIDELTHFEQRPDGLLRREILAQWRHPGLPFDHIDEIDRYRFVAGVIHGAVGDAVMVEPFAKWLIDKVDCQNLQRIERWAEELEGLVEVTSVERNARAPLVSELIEEMKKVLRKE